MTAAHSTRAHARLAPSAASRWFECPGSVRLSDGIENKSSLYADEGSAAHELAAYCLRNDMEPDLFDGEFVDINAKTDKARFTKEGGDGRFIVDADMIAGVGLYLDHVRKLARPNVEIAVEQLVDLSYLGIPGLDGGTADFLAYDPATKSMSVVDLKYGRGVPVDPDKNKQALCYALGAIQRYSNRGLSKVILTIVQPRCPHPAGPVRTWSADVVDLLDFEDELRERAIATTEADAPLAAGPWCRFCPVGATCTVRRDHGLKLAQAEFDAVGNMTLPVVSTMSPGELGETLGRVTEIEDWCRRVKEHAHLEAVHGRMPEGWKLVQKRATRKWMDESDAADALAALGVDTDKIWTQKIVTPAQADKLVGSKNKKALEPYYSKQSSGTVLAPEHDSRPAARADASEFNEVT